MASPSRKPAAKKSAKKVARPAAAKATKKAKPAKADGGADVQAWLDAVKPEHKALVKRIDALIGKTIPGIQRHAKWRKPSQPLGVPFYGRPGQGWLMALWSFKGYVAVALYARGLDPAPPVTAFVQARGLHIHNDAEYDEAQLRSWLGQSCDLPGWGAGSPEFRT